MEQPDLEFLATDIFGIMQTGKRVISGLSVKFSNTPVPTFESGQQLSSLFGQALYTNSPGYVYIDADGQDLQFSGNTSAVTSFTVGCYMYGPHTIYETYGQVVWGEIIMHYFADTTDVPYFRVMPHKSATEVCMGYNIGPDTFGYSTSYVLSSAQQTSWIHLAFTYEASTGILSTYVDGQLEVTNTLFPWNENGNSGAYAF